MVETIRSANVESGMHLGWVWRQSAGSGREQCRKWQEVKEWAKPSDLSNLARPGQLQGGLKIQ